MDPLRIRVWVGGIAVAGLGSVVLESTANASSWLPFGLLAALVLLFLALVLANHAGRLRRARRARSSSDPGAVGPQDVVDDAAVSRGE